MSGAPFSPKEVAEDRLALATATEYDKIIATVSRARSLLQAPIRDDAARHAAVQKLATASYQIYAVGDREASISLVDDAAPIAEKIEDNILRLRAQCLVSMARHRLYRNMSNTALAAEHSRLTDLMSELCDVDNLFPEVGKVRLELSHFYRYTGDAEIPLEAYPALLPPWSWHAAGLEYQKCLVNHYAISLACDWIELFALPIALSGEGGRLKSNYDSLLINVLQFYEPPRQWDKFPTLNLSYLKHWALFLAARRHPEADSVVAELDRQARTDLIGRLKKLRLLHSLFRAMVEVIRTNGNRTEALALLQEVEEEARHYYPRAERRAAFQAGVIHLFDGNSTVAVHCFERAQDGARNHHFACVAAALKVAAGSPRPLNLNEIIPAETLVAFDSFVPQWIQVFISKPANNKEESQARGAIVAAVVHNTMNRQPIAVRELSASTESAQENAVVDAGSTPPAAGTSVGLGGEGANMPTPNSPVPSKPSRDKQREWIAHRGVAYLFCAWLVAAIIGISILPGRPLGFALFFAGGILAYECALVLRSGPERRLEEAMCREKNSSAK